MKSVKSALRESKNLIPSTDVVFGDSIEDLDLENRSEFYIRNNFEEILKSMMDRGLEILEYHQMKAQREFFILLSENRGEFEDMAEKILAKALKNGSAIEKLGNLYTQALTDFPPLTEFLVSMSNMRKARAGSHFQKAIEYLLERCGINSERGGRLTGRTDLILPDIATFNARPEKSVLLELKHTMRERWKTATVEKYRTTHTVWIVTLDDKFGSDTVDEIEKMKLVVYAPERFKGEFQDKPCVRKLSNLVRNIEDLIP